MTAKSLVSFNRAYLWSVVGGKWIDQSIKTQWLPTRNRPLLNVTQAVVNLLLAALLL